MPKIRIIQREEHQIVTPKDYSDPIYAEKSSFNEKRHYSAAIARNEAGRDENSIPVEENDNTHDVTLEHPDPPNFAFAE